MAWLVSRTRHFGTPSASEPEAGPPPRKSVILKAILISPFWVFFLAIGSPDAKALADSDQLAEWLFSFQGAFFAAGIVGAFFILGGFTILGLVLMRARPGIELAEAFVPIGGEGATFVTQATGPLALWLEIDVLRPPGEAIASALFAHVELWSGQTQLSKERYVMTWDQRPKTSYYAGIWSLGSRERQEQRLQARMVQRIVDGSVRAGGRFRAHVLVLNAVASQAPVTAKVSVEPPTFPCRGFVKAFLSKQ